MRLLFTLLLTIIIYAQPFNDILKKIPNNSADYSLAKILISKANNIKFQKPSINLNPKNEQEYINSFHQLIKLLQQLYNLPVEIKELETKISILKKQTTPIAKLQIIYFSKLLKNKKETLIFLNKNLPYFKKTLYNKLNRIIFNTKKANKNIKKLQKKLRFYEKETEKLKINLQKWNLLKNKTKVIKTKHLINTLLKQQKNIYQNLFDNQLVIWLNYIKEKNKKTFIADKDLMNCAKKIDPNFYKSAINIISDFEKYAFGAKVLVYDAKNGFEIFKQKLINIINYPIFTVDNRTITPLNFAVFILVLLIGWFAGKYYKYLIYKLRHKKNISFSTATLLANIGYYTILTLSFLIALKVVGLDLSSLAIIAGALSVGIGFGLQNIVNNFISGIILMFERSIKVGDYIQIDQNTRGEVVDISMRSTIIRTNDNINLIIPNQSFIQNNVINWTLGDDIVRFRVPFGVAYGTDIDKVEKTVLNAIQQSDLPFIRKHRSFDVTPHVIFIEMADSSLNFELFVWVKGEYARRPRRTRSEFLKIIYNALNKAGINIPFPQQDLHIKDSVPFEVTIKKQ